MRALVLSEARLREPSLVERFAYYQKLAGRRLTLSVERSAPGRLVERCPPGWHRVALDERGEHWTSVDLAARLGAWERTGTTGVVFLVGAADGLPPDVRASVDDVLALSRLTLPHQLCMVILAEQLYRATTILLGGGYHRA